MAEAFGQSKYKEEFEKATSLGNNLYPQGYDKKKYDIGWMLAFGKITFAEYKKRLKALNKEYGK